jgi:single-strand DNA-binding protein
MSETLVTVVGNVATQPELRQTSTGVPVARFRVATTERRYDRSGDRWTDGHTSFYTVWAWRALGENVCGSIAMGEPVIIQGKLRITEREDKGQSYLSASIDAVAVGHDLSRGTSAFRRVFKSRGDWGDRSPDTSGGTAVSDAMWMQPPPAGSGAAGEPGEEGLAAQQAATSVPTIPPLKPEGARGRASSKSRSSSSTSGLTGSSGSSGSATAKTREPELVPS